MNIQKNNKDKLIIAESLLNNRMLGIKDDALNYLKNNVKIMDSNTKLEAGSVVIFLHDFFFQIFRSGKRFILMVGGAENVSY